MSGLLYRQAMSALKATPLHACIALQAGNISTEGFTLACLGCSTGRQWQHWRLHPCMPGLLYRQAMSALKATPLHALVALQAGNVSTEGYTLACLGCSTGRQCQHWRLHPCLPGLLYTQAIWALKVSEQLCNTDKQLMLPLLVHHFSYHQYVTLVWQSAKTVLEALQAVGCGGLSQQWQSLSVRLPLSRHT